MSRRKALCASIAAALCFKVPKRQYKRVLMKPLSVCWCMRGQPYGEVSSEWGRSKAKTNYQCAHICETGPY